MRPEIISIAGGAGPREAAAIVAVVAHLLEEEAEAAAAPPDPLRQSPWVLAGRPRRISVPQSRSADGGGWTGEDASLGDG